MMSDELAALTAKAQALILDDSDDESDGDEDALEPAPPPLEEARADHHTSSPAADEPGVER